jgi:hypothetical protein
MFSRAPNTHLELHSAAATRFTRADAEVEVAQRKPLGALS